MNIIDHLGVLMKNFTFLLCLTLMLTNVFIECSVQQPDLSDTTEQILRYMFTRDYNKQINEFRKNNATEKAELVTTIVPHQDGSATVCLSMIMNNQKLGIERIYTLTEIQHTLLRKHRQELNIPSPFNQKFDVIF